MCINSGWNVVKTYKFQAEVNKAMILHHIMLEQVIYIRNLEPNCQSSYSYSYSSSVPRLSPNLRNPLKIFACLSNHLPVFLLGTENVVGGWMAILVVVCGKICGTICGKMCGKMCGKKSKKTNK